MTNIITDTTDHILRTFFVFHFLTVEQVKHLQFGEGSNSYVSTLLNNLFKQQYLRRQPLPSIIRAGSVPYMYYLDKKARRYLQTQGYRFSKHPFPATIQELSYETLRHALSVTEFLIAGCQLAKQTSGLSLVTVLHDLTIRHLTQYPVVFDGWMHFVFQEKEEYCLALEYERTEKDEQAFASKIIALLRFVTPDPLTRKSQYEAIFRTDVLTIAYVTPISESYCRKLRSWTEQVLTHANRIADADVFRFLYLAAGAVDPAVYRLPVWSQPLKTQLVSLLDV